MLQQEEDQLKKAPAKGEKHGERHNEESKPGLLGRAGHSGGTEPIGSVPRFLQNFGS